MCKTESKHLNKLSVSTPRFTQLDFFNLRFSSIPQIRSHYVCLHITYHHENHCHQLPSPLNAPPTLSTMTPPQCQWMTVPFPTVFPTVCNKVHRGCRLFKKLVSTLFMLLICFLCSRLSRDRIVLWSLIKNSVLTDCRVYRHSGVLSLTIQLPSKR